MILALVPIHILANFWYGLAKKEPLITAMVTGKKPAADYLDAPEAEIVGRPMLRALVCLVGGGGLALVSRHCISYGCAGGQGRCDRRPLRMKAGRGDVTRSCKASSASSPSR